MKTKRFVYVIESRDKRLDGTWAKWIIGEAFANRQDAINAGCPCKEFDFQVRVTKYVSTR